MSIFTNVNEEDALIYQTIPSKLFENLNAFIRIEDCCSRLNDFVRIETKKKHGEVKKPEIVLMFRLVDS